MIAGLLLLAVVLSPASAQELHLRASVDNPGRLRLGDLASVQVGLESHLSQTVEVDPASAWVLSPTWLLDRLALPQSLTIVGDRVTVIPTTWDVPRPVVEALGTWLRGQTSDPTVVFELQEVRLLEGEIVDSGSLRLSRLSGERTFDIPNGYWVWRLENAGRTGRVRALLRPQLAALRATRTLPRGAVPSPETVRVEYTPLSRFPRRPMTSVDLNGRWRLNQTVRDGNVLYAHFLSPIYDVEAQAEVRLVVQRPGLRVELSGVALESGNAGDRIRVRPVHSSKSLRGAVVSEGEVHVESF